MSFNGLNILTAKLKETMGTLKPVILKVFAIEWEKSVRKNFEAGGRPVKWKPRKRISKKQKGTRLMVISGALKNYRATVSESESRIILTSDPRARAYSAIHDKGGVINIPSRTVRHREKRYRDGSRRTVFASSKHKNIKSTTQTKAYTITMPKREHTNFPQEDFQRAMNALKPLIKL